MRLDTVPVDEFKPGLIGNLVTVKIIPRDDTKTGGLLTYRTKKFVGRLSGYSISEDVVEFTLSDFGRVALYWADNVVEIYAHPEQKVRQR